MKTLDDTMRESVTQTQLLTIPTAGKIVIPPNIRRVAITLQPALAAQLQLRLGTTGTDGGFSGISPGDPPLSFSLHDHGDLIRREMSISGTATDTFLFSESLCGCG